MQQQQSIYVPTGGGTTTGTGRPNQGATLYRAPTSGPRTRHNIPMFQPQPMPQMVMTTPFFPAHAPRQQTSQIYSGSPYFSQNQLPLNPYHQFYFNSFVHRPGVQGSIVPPGATLTPGPTVSQTPLLSGQVITAEAGGQPGAAQTAGTTNNAKPKRRKYALEIIHPETRHNILDEIELSKDQNSTSTQEVEYSDSMNLPPGNELISGNVGPVPPQQIDSALSTDSTYNNKQLQNIAFLDMMQHHKISVGVQGVNQVNEMIGPTTPIVSAMSDGPSVEIHPKQQTKKKSRAIEPIPPPQTQISSVSVDNKTTVDNSKTSSVTDSGHINVVNEGIADKNLQQMASSNTNVPLANNISEENIIPTNKAIHNRSDSENNSGKINIQQSSVAAVASAAVPTVSAATTLQQQHPSSYIGSSNTNIDPKLNSSNTNNSSSNLTNTTTVSTSSNSNSQQISSSAAAATINQQTKRETKSFQQQKSDRQQQSTLPSSANNNLTSVSNIVVSGNSNNNSSINSQSSLASNNNTKTFATLSSNISSQTTAASSNLQSIQAVSTSSAQQQQSSKQSDLNLNSTVLPLSTTSNNMAKSHKGKDKSQHHHQQQTSNNNNNNNNNNSSGIESATLLPTGGSSTIPPDKQNSANNNFHQPITAIEKTKDNNSKHQKLTNDRNSLPHSYSRSDKNENIISEDDTVSSTSRNKKSNTTGHTAISKAAVIDSSNDTIVSSAQPLDETDRVGVVNTFQKSVDNSNYCNNNDKPFSTDSAVNSINNLTKTSASKPLSQQSDDSSRTQQKYVASKDSAKMAINDTSSVAIKPSEATTIDITSSENDKSATITNGTITPVSGPLSPLLSGNGIEKTPSLPVTVPSLISYNEGQWSPANPNGLKIYDRSQLFQLQDAPAAKNKPNIKPEIASIVMRNVRIPQPGSLMPQFVNKRGQSMGGASNISMGGGSMTGIAGNAYLKQTSLSGVNAKNSSKGSKTGVIYMSLSLREDVKLNETENAWRPAHLKQNEELPPEERAKEEIFRKVRGILNKLTPEKFDTLVDEIMKLQIDTKEKVNGVMMLVFEKAIDEPNFSASYAKLCQRLGENKLQSEIKAAKDGGKLSAAEQKASNLAAFKNTLIDKTEREFKDNVSDCQAKERKLQPLIKKIANCTDPDRKIELQSSLEEEERKIRRRSGGTVRFIGELFKISMLTGNIIKNCIDSLLDPTSEDKLECLCKLLTTVGKKFESTPLNKDSSRTHSLEDVISKMKMIADRRADSKISSRVRFMLLNVIDLRKYKWVSTKTDANPKTMDQIQKEVKTEQMNSQYANYNLMTNKKDERRYGGTGGSGSTGNNMSFSNSGVGNNSGGSSGGNSGFYKSNRSQQGGDETWHTQTSNKNRAVDTNKLGQMFNAGIDIGTKLGGMTKFQWNQGSNNSVAAPTTVTSNSFAPLSGLESNKSSNGGPRNKGSYNKGSLERDKYDGIHGRGGSAHGSRESSSSRHSSVRGNDKDRDSGRGSMQRGGGSGNIAPSHHSSFGSSISSSVPSRPNISRPPISSSSSTELLSCSSTSESEFERNEDAYKAINSAISQIIISATDDSIESTIPIFNNFLNKHRWYFIYALYYEYLHSTKVKVSHRKTAAKVVLFLLNKNYITLSHFKYAYLEISNLVDDLMIDVPEFWKYVFPFIGPLVYNNAISIKEFWNEVLLEKKLGRKFLKEMILYFTKECGPKYTKDLFRNNFKWTDFLDPNDVDKFIQKENFEYIKSENSDPPFFGNEKPDFQYIKERLKELLQGSANSDTITDYLNGNINITNVDKTFVRLLTDALCSASVIHSDNKPHKLDKNKFANVCIPLFQRFLDSNEERELQCLYTLQLFVHELEHPSGLLNDIFVELYESDSISVDSFNKWRDSKEEPNGKGVAVKALNPFFTNVLSGETSEENN